MEKTITSVLDQNYPKLEYIIIDGGSTDNSVEIIKKYEKYLKYWVTEKDKGQAHAINKGLIHCTGDIFNWLNSDDYLESGALQKIATAFEDDSVHMVAGKVNVFSTETAEVVKNQNLTAQGLMCWEKDVKFVQPGVWLRRKLVSNCGGIDEEFHYAFDWDLYIRYLYHFPAVKEIENLLVHFRLHHQSKTVSFADRFNIEENGIIKKISGLEEFSKLHRVCNYKIEKTNWTKLLTEESKNSNNLALKIWHVLRAMPTHRKIAFTRQTAGAIKAFINKQEIS